MNLFALLIGISSIGSPAYEVGAVQRPNELPKLVIVRNGGSERSQTEIKALANVGEKEIEALVKSGYIKVQLDAQLLLLVDPMAQPIRDFRVQRLLAETFGEPGKAKRYGDLSPEAKRAVRESLTPTVVPQNELSDDTMVGTMATVQVRMQFGAKRDALSYDINQGPNHDRKSFLDSLGAKPMRPSKQKPEAIEAQARAQGKLTSSDLIFSASLNLSGLKPQVYLRCTQKIAELAEDEKKQRDMVYAALVKKLAEANPKLGGLQSNSWDKDSMPPEVANALKDNFVNGWQANGYASRDAASAAWGAGSVTESGVAFFVVVATSNGSSIPSYYRGQIGFTAR